MIAVLVVALFVVVPIALLAFLVKTPRAGAHLSRAGLMELQNLLEPERKVEILRERESKEELLVQVDENGET